MFTEMQADFHTIQILNESNSCLEGIKGHSFDKSNVFCCCSYIVSVLNQAKTQIWFF